MNQIAVNITFEPFWSLFPSKGLLFSHWNVFDLKSSKQDSICASTADESEVFLSLGSCCTSSARIPSFVTEAEITPPPKRNLPGRLKIDLSLISIKKTTRSNQNLQFFKCPRPAPSNFWAACLAWRIVFLVYSGAYWTSSFNAWILLVHKKGNHHGERVAHQAWSHHRTKESHRRHSSSTTALQRRFQVLCNIIV